MNASSGRTAMRRVSSRWSSAGSVNGYSWSSNSRKHRSSRTSIDAAGSWRLRRVQGRPSEVRPEVRHCPRALGIKHAVDGSPIRGEDAMVDGIGRGRSEMVLEPEDPEERVEAAAPRSALAYTTKGRLNRIENTQPWKESVTTKSADAKQSSQCSTDGITKSAGFAAYASMRRRPGVRSSSGGSPSRSASTPSMRRTSSFVSSR